MGPLLQEKGELEHLIGISVTVSFQGLGSFLGLLYYFYLLI